MELDNEVKGTNNSYDFGARIQDPRVARWLSVDPLESKYPSQSPYNFVANVPTMAMDPDGRYIIFIGGLRLSEGDMDQGGNGPYGPSAMSLAANPQPGIYTGNYEGPLRDYWKGEPNSFGETVDIAQSFMEKIGETDAAYLSGSSGWTSSANQRYDEGVVKANLFHKMVQAGDISLAEGETIKIVTHSQGAAHGSGFADRIIELGYEVEVIYNITPHQPTDITAPEGVRSVQYSHPSDAVSSAAPGVLGDGNSSFGRIKGIDEFDGRDVMGPGSDHPEVTPEPMIQGSFWGLSTGNRGGHNVDDNNFIFNIPEGRKGYVAPRKDVIKAPAMRSGSDRVRSTGTSTGGNGGLGNQLKK